MKTTSSKLVAAIVAMCGLVATFSPAFAQEEVNLAQGLLAVTESTSTAPGSSLKNLTDGNDYSLWRGATPAKVDFDLGEAKMVNRVDLHIPPQYVTSRNQEVSIQISKDGEKFEEAIEFASRAFTHGNKGRVSLNVGKEARYVRILIDSNDKDDGEALLSEVRIF